MSILSIKNISKFYTLDGKHQEQALRNINLQIAKGKITAIYGPSGCGKTSLLNIISGLDRQYEGDLEFKGESLRDLSEIELTQFRKKQDWICVSKTSTSFLINLSWTMSSYLSMSKIYLTGR